MKKQFLTYVSGLFILALTAMTSCISSQSFFPVKGNGMAVDKNFKISGFNEIEVSGGFDVILSQGSDEGVVLTAQENLFEFIHVEVAQGVLKIYTDGNIMPTKSMKAEIAFKNINHVDVSGGGDVSATADIKAEDLVFEISGGGDLFTTVNTGNLGCRLNGGGDARINGKSNKVDVNMSGGGDLESLISASVIFCDLSGGGDLTLKCDEEASEVNIDLTGGGDADVSIQAQKVKCSLSGGGNAGFSGKATDLEVTLSGGGDLNASDFETTTATFQANGGSDIHLRVSRELKGNISGGGDVYYYGSPEIVTVDARGGSEVHKQ